MVSTKTSIFFIRHGEVDNPNDVWYGRLPGFGLSENGKKQSAQTADFLRSKNISNIYSSPLLRAAQTAKILKNTLKLPEIIFSDDLLEIQSSFEGTPFTQIRAMNYDVFADTERNITGETIDDILKRMRRFIGEATIKYAGKNIVAVSHGDPITIVKALTEELPMKNESLRPGHEYYIHPGEVYEFSVDNTTISCKSIFRP